MMHDCLGPEVAANGREGANDKADASRERTILARLSERSVSAAAKRAGVGERTIRRWLTNDPNFRTELAEARRAMFQVAVERAQVLTSRAVEVLEELLAERTHPSVRLGAARLILEFSVNRDDAASVWAKLEELERLQEGTKRL